MAYCHFAKDSDLLLYHNVDGYYECCGCRLTPKINNTDMHDNVQFQDVEECLKHLLTHIEAGHKVPSHAFERLREERIENSSGPNKENSP